MAATHASSRERLEDRLDVMMARASISTFTCVRTGANREPLEEIVDELGLQVADALDLHFEINGGMRPSPSRWRPRQRRPSA